MGGEPRAAPSSLLHPAAAAPCQLFPLGMLFKKQSLGRERSGAALAVGIWGFPSSPRFLPARHFWDGIAGCPQPSPRTHRLGKNRRLSLLVIYFIFIYPCCFIFGLSFASLQHFNTEGTATAGTLYPDRRWLGRTGRREPCRTAAPRR